ncbi:MAG: hypothetical protein KF773_24270 [Deltaproteobacteria bacterium]|nr:hypothetical protein [Deltaproteobacteria bacterium]
MARPRSFHAQTTPACRLLTPGARLVRLALHDAGGRAYDANEALDAMRPTHWAWPYREVLRYLGSARSWHLWELLPEDEGTVDAKRSRS